MALSSTAPALRWLRSPLVIMAASVLCVALILAALVATGVHERILVLLAWIEAQGAWAALLFVLVMAAAVVLLLPGLLFTLGAGFVFGLVEGTVLVVAGTTLGAALAFLMARHLFGERARAFVLARSRLKMLDDTLTPYGGRIVLLTRLIPFFPAKLANYAFGLTRFSLGGFVLGSAVGFIPFSLHNVYLGSIAADLTALGTREEPRSWLEWSVYGAGFVATVIAVYGLNRLARRALDRYTREQTPTEEMQ